MNIYIHKYIVMKAIMSIDGFFCHLQSLACIKFLQIIIIFPPQTCNQGGKPKSQGGTIDAEVISMLVGNVFGKP